MSPSGETFLSPAGIIPVRLSFLLEEAIWGQLNSHGTEQCPFLEISFPFGTSLIAAYHVIDREERRVWRGGCAGAWNSLKWTTMVPSCIMALAVQAAIERRAGLLSSPSAGCWGMSSLRQLFSFPELLFYLPPDVFSHLWSWATMFLERSPSQVMKNDLQWRYLSPFPPDMRLVPQPTFHPQPEPYWAASQLLHWGLLSSSSRHCCIAASYWWNTLVWRCDVRRQTPLQHPQGAGTHVAHSYGWAVSLFRALALWGLHGRLSTGNSPLLEAIVFPTGERPFSALQQVSSVNSGLMWSSRPSFIALHLSQLSNSFRKFDSILSCSFF